MSQMQITTGSQHGSAVTRHFGCGVAVGGALALIGLLVLGIAVWGILGGTAALNELPGPVIIGAIFTLVGLGVISLVRNAATQANQRERLRAANPDKPWMWREGWASGRIADSGRSAVKGLWAFGLLWSAFTFPFAWLLLRDNPADKRALIVLIFPAVGIILLLVAVRLTLQRMKHGQSHLVLSTLPGVIGRHLRGTVETNFKVAPPDGATVTLACVQRVTTGTGKRRSTREESQWQDVIELESMSLQPGMSGINIPLSFEIPPGLPQSDDSNPNDQIIWRVDVTAAVPGIDYSENFEVPVFDTGATPISEEERQASRDRRRAKSRGHVPADPLVRISQNASGGTEFHFAPRRKPGSTIRGVLFTAGSWAAVWALLHYGAPIGFPIFVGLFALLMTAGLLISLFHTSTVIVQRPAVTVKNRVLGIGPTRLLDASEITDVVAEAVGEPKATSWEVKVKTAGGKSYSAASLLTDQKEAEWTAEKIRQAIKPF